MNLLIRNYYLIKYNSKKGWYKIQNVEKFIKPLDEYMESTKRNDSGTFIQYKSRLERIAFHYADINPKIKYFSIEPFFISYIKPTDNKVHRYYIDMFIEFVTGDKFLVEVKSFNETQAPQKPKNKSNKYMSVYKDRLEIYLTNSSKWRSAEQFAKSKNMKFIILTEKELCN